MKKLKSIGYTNHAISQILSVPLRTVQRHTVGLGPRNSGLIPLPHSAKTLTAEKAKIHAYLVAEGCYEETRRIECDNRTGCRYHKTYRILHFYTKTPEMWDDFIKCVKSVYNYHPYCFPKRYVIKIKRVAVVNDLMKWGPYNSLEWRVPAEILDSNREIQLSWFAALFDSEGHVKKGSGAEIAMCNYPGLKQVKTMCEKLGFFCNLRGPYSQGFNHSPIYLLYFPKAEMHKFLEVPLVHPRKVERIKVLSANS